MIETHIASLAGAVADAVAAHQRALHQIPELAFQEHETARYVSAALAALGLQPRTGIAGTGIVAELPGAGEGPTVLLRADMDGLPIEEDLEHEPRSRHEGRMHACGHDGHMAVVLGATEAALRLARTVAPWPGRLVVLFQPAEEGGTGAARMVEEGVLDDFRIDHVLGLHLWSPLTKGKAIIPDGTVMASADEFRVVLKGKGGHGALPHEANDVVLALSHLVVSLQAIVAREIDPVLPAVVTVGRIQAGTAPNVLPMQGSIDGTFRAPTTEVRARLLHRVGEMAQAIALAHGVTAEVEFGSGIPPTVNHPREAAAMRRAAAAVLGAANVAAGPPTMAAEDFGLYLQKRPGAFMLLGMRDEERSLVEPHHHPHFRIAPDVLPQGVEILLRAALLVMREAQGEASP